MRGCRPSKQIAAAQTVALSSDRQGPRWRRWIPGPRRRGSVARGVLVGRVTTTRRVAGRCAPDCRTGHARHSLACPTAVRSAPARSRRPRRVPSRRWRRGRRCGSGRRSGHPWRRARSSASPSAGLPHMVVRQDDLDVGLRGAADGDPAEAFAGDVVAQFEAERIAVEGQCEVGVMDLDEATGKSEIHAPKLESQRPARFSDPARPAARAGEVLGDAARHARECAVVTGTVGRRRLAHQMGEACAERAERRTPGQVPT